MHPAENVSIGYQSFIERQPDPATHLRGVVLFGRNTTSYKFALTKALLDLAAEQRTTVTLPELAPVFTRYIAAHAQTGMAQGTVPKSTFLAQ